jgi:hypothetical protein
MWLLEQILLLISGETDQDLRRRLDLAKNGLESWVCGNVLSRPGTAAWRMYKDDDAACGKKQRWEILDKIINKTILQSSGKLV